MDEYDGLESEADDTPEEPKAGSDKDWQAEVAKREKENAKLRAELRRVKLGTKFGPEIAELIPAQLPAEEWEGYAERLAALKGTAPGNTAEGTQAAEAPTPLTEEQKEAEAGFAAVAQTPRTGTTPPATLSGREIQELIQRDPKAAEAAMRAKYGDKPVF